MGVIVESQEGEKIVIISGFYECEHGTQFSLEKVKKFNIGDIVYFIDDYKDKNETLDYLAYKVIFKTEDGKIYSAIPTFFVTLEEWKNIENYFKK